MRATPIMLTTGLCFILAACNAPETATTQPSSASSTPAAAPAAPAQDATPPQPAPPADVSSASASTTGDADSSGTQIRYFDCAGTSVTETLGNGGSDAIVLVNGARYDMKRAGSGSDAKYADPKGNTLAGKGSDGAILTMSGEKDISCKEELKKKD